MGVHVLSMSSYFVSLFVGNVTWILGLLLCAGFVVPFVQWFRVWKALRPLPGPWDAVPFWFILGCFKSVIQENKANKHATAWIFSKICSMCQRYTGRLFKVYVGMTPIVVLQTPDAVEALLTSSVNHKKPFLYHFIAPWLGPLNILVATGEAWRFKRKLMTPAFHFRVLDNYMRIFNENGDLLVKHLCSVVDTAPDEPIRLFKSTQRCAMDIIGEVTMGAKLQLQEDKNLYFMRAFNRVMFLLSVRAFRPWLWIQTIYDSTREGKVFRADLQKMMTFTYSVMRKRKDKLQCTDTCPKCDTENDELISGGETTLMNILLRKHIQDSSYTLADVRNDIDTIIAAGNDTTTTCMCWTLHYLGLYPEVQAKVHEELDEIFGNDTDGEITATHIRQMKYLECCLKEALRLYPSFPVIGRVLDEELTMEGHVIPKGVTCFISIYSLHRNPKYFKDPEEFIPERFLSEEIKTRHPFSYIPFSGGSKNCIGQKFAMLEMKLLMAKVLRKCKMVSSEPLDQLDVAYEVIVKDKGGNKGTDTITTCMCFTLHYLGLYPEAQAKSHQELDEIFGDDTDCEITATHIRQMKYIECCLKESLRLYPSFPVIGRVLDEDVTMEGHVIPKGVMCFISIYSLHRNPKYFKDPEEFIPERFLSEEIKTRHPFSYIPFSGGSKNCLGQKFAMLEMKLLLAKILLKCKIVSAEPLDRLDVAYEVIVKDKRGNRVWVRRRTEVPLSRAMNAPVTYSH